MINALSTWILSHPWEFIGFIGACMLCGIGLWWRTEAKQGNNHNNSHTISVQCSNCKLFSVRLNKCISFYEGDCINGSHFIAWKS